MQIDDPIHKGLLKIAGGNLAILDEAIQSSGNTANEREQNDKNEEPAAVTEEAHT